MNGFYTALTLSRLKRSEAARGDFEIERILHLKSEIANWTRNLAREASPI